MGTRGGARAVDGGEYVEGGEGLRPRVGQRWLIYGQRTRGGLIATSVCSGSHQTSSPHTNGATGSIVYDPAVTYPSLPALRRATSSVAVLAPTATTHRISIGGVPFTITRVRVQETLAGKRLARTILLRQTARRE